LLLLHGESYQTSHWQECASNRLSRHSCLHCPSTTLPRAACSHSPEEESAIFRRQQQVRQWGRYWRSRLRFHRCVEERRPYFPERRQRSDQRPWSYKVQCWAFDIQAQTVDESVLRSEKASRNTFKLLQSVRWAALLQQCGRSIRGYRYHL